MLQLEELPADVTEELPADLRNGKGRMEDFLLSDARFGYSRETPSLSLMRCVLTY